MIQRPTLHLLMGLPGSGKSTLARTLESITGGKRLSSDEERLKLYPDPDFTQDEHDSIYAILDHSVEHLLESGKDVIYDANLNRKEHRDEKYTLAEKSGAKVILWHVDVDQSLAKKRRVSEQDERLVPDDETPSNMFDRIASVIEFPEPPEQCVKVDGTKITEAYVADLLASLR